MKKMVLFVALAATLTSNAQVEVRSNGQIALGNPAQSETSSTPVSFDTKATVTVFGLDDAHEGYISFGDSHKVSVGEWGSSNSDVLKLIGAKGNNISVKSGFKVEKGGSLRIQK